MNVGYIGTGTMGNPMARCLLDAGHAVTVYDVRREAATNLCELGANWADSPRLVAEASRVVFTSVPGPVEAEQVLTDPETGILAGLSPRRSLDRHHHQRAVGDSPVGPSVRAGRGRYPRLAGERPTAQYDHDGRRRPGRI